MRGCLVPCFSLVGLLVLLPITAHGQERHAQAPAQASPAPTPSATPTPSPTPQPAPSPQATPTPQPTPPPTAEQRKRGAALIDKAVRAMGGAAAVDKVKSLEIRARGTRRLPGGSDIEVQTTTRIVFPDRYRQDTTLPGGTVSTILGPLGAFLTIETAGALPLPDEETATLKRTVRRNLVALLQARKEPSFSPAATLSGKEQGDSVGVNVGGETLTLKLDPKTGHIREADFIGSSGAGAQGRIVVNYSDYRPVDGLMYPFALSGTFDGQPSFDSKLDSVTVNPTLADALFMPPPPPSPEPPAEPGAAGAPPETVATPPPVAPTPASPPPGN